MTYFLQYLFFIIHSVIKSIDSYCPSSSFPRSNISSSSNPLATWLFFSFPPKVSNPFLVSLQFCRSKYSFSVQFSSRCVHGSIKASLRRYGKCPPVHLSGLSKRGRGEVPVWTLVGGLWGRWFTLNEGIFQIVSFWTYLMDICFQYLYT